MSDGGALPAAPREAAALAPRVRGDPYTAMTPEFGRLARVFGERFFAGFRFEGDDAQRLAEIEQRGAVVYVMRYSSRLDYFLFNWLFRREGLRLSAWANGIRFYYYRPFREALRLLVRGLVERLRVRPADLRARSLGALDEALRSGASLFLFLRTDKIRSRLPATRRGALRSGRSELDVMREVVQTAATEGLAVNLIPLALFWRKGSRAQRRFLNLFYGAPERPTDTGKMLSFLWNYRNLAVRVGTPIDLTTFTAERRNEPLAALVAKLRRTLLIFLRREEKPVAGAALRPLHRVEELVIADSAVQDAIGQRAAVSGRRREEVEARARRYLREIAARPSSSMLAVLDVIVTRIFARLFDRVEVHGLDRIAAAAKQSPLVLVPCHRSHFDYLILSWLFYERHLVPPMVAAGINLAFWPLGGIFRRAGAFFLRRTFDGNALYAAVFRRYVQQLIKDGTTQEFFIEGTRSRTGRTLPPRLGMLAMVLEAYARGVRRDVYLVPVGFTYERLVEERAMSDERRGERKTRESLLGLLRSRSVLRNRFGTVFVRFGEPLSLAVAVGADRKLLAEGSTHAQAGAAEAAGAAADAGAAVAGAATDARRRELVERLGFEVCARLNALLTAGRTSVAAAALLATPARGVLRDEFAWRVRAIATLLERLDVPLADTLRDDLRRGGLGGLLELLERAGLVRRTDDGGQELVHFEEAGRDMLDYYRSSIAPALAFGAALALASAQPQPRDALLRDASDWLDLLELEYLPPAGPERARRLATALELVTGQGWLEEGPAGLERTVEGVRALPLFAAQVRPVLEAYGAAFEVVLQAQGEGTRTELERTALATLRRHLLVGEAQFAEALSPGTIANALLWLQRTHMLELAGEVRRGEARLCPGPRYPELKSLRARIAAAAR